MTTDVVSCPHFALSIMDATAGPAAFSMLSIQQSTNAAGILAQISRVIFEFRTAGKLTRYIKSNQSIVFARATLAAICISTVLSRNECKQRTESRITGSVIIQWENKAQHLIPFSVNPVTASRNKQNYQVSVLRGRLSTWEK